MLKSLRCGGATKPCPVKTGTWMSSLYRIKRSDKAYPTRNSGQEMTLKYSYWGNGWRTDLVFCSIRTLLSSHERGKFTLNLVNASYEIGIYLTIWNTLGTKEGKLGLVQVSVTPSKPADQDSACIKVKRGGKSLFLLPKDTKYLLILPFWNSHGKYHSLM